MKRKKNLTHHDRKLNKTKVERAIFKKQTHKNRFFFRQTTNIIIMQYELNENRSTWLQSLQISQKATTQAHIFVLQQRLVEEKNLLKIVLI